MGSRGQTVVASTPLAAGLIHSALADLKARGFRLAQAVLDESAGCRRPVT